jgi:hypothetical protein
MIADDLLIENPFPTLPVRIENTQAFRTLALTLFNIETSLINAFTVLHEESKSEKSSWRSWKGPPNISTTLSTFSIQRLTSN